MKAHEVLGRVRELVFLQKRVKRFPDPPAQFRLLASLRNPMWSKSCGWNQGESRL